MDVELRDLRLAVVTSQYRSLRQAAEALNMRQSTLSRRLSYVEDRLGAQLFERTAGGTRPTFAGLEFITGARRILEEVEAEVSRLKARSKGSMGVLTIGVYASPSAGNMHMTLVDYHRRYPEVEVHTVDGNHDRLLCGLTSNTVDIAIMTAHATGWDDGILPLWSERVIVAVPEHHPLGRSRRILWTDLANEKFLFPRQGPGRELEHLLVAKLPNAPSTHQILHQDSSLDRLLSLVGADYGALLMFEGATGARYDGVLSREVWDDREPTRVCFMAYWRRTNSNPALEPFLAMLRERYPDLSA